LSKLNPVEEVEIIKVSWKLMKNVLIKFSEDLSIGTTVIRGKARKRLASTNKYVMITQAYLSPQGKTNTRDVPTCHGKERKTFCSKVFIKKTLCFSDYFITI
jgi:hypothetical protein